MSATAFPEGAAPKAPGRHSELTTEFPSPGPVRSARLTGRAAINLVLLLIAAFAGLWWDLGEGGTPGPGLGGRDRD